MWLPPGSNAGPNVAAGMAAAVPTTKPPAVTERDNTSVLHTVFRKGQDRDTHSYKKCNGFYNRCAVNYSQLSSLIPSRLEQRHFCSKSEYKLCQYFPEKAKILCEYLKHNIIM